MNATYKDLLILNFKEARSGAVKLSGAMSILLLQNFFICRPSQWVVSKHGTKLFGRSD